ncbi:sulfurtransferase [Sulfurimonas sp. SAG-AH-194-I05]|nr:rhodanese-like domain-containing protein [Sulfurimonas sp. SAG-AH-194-I05]MDF1875105.1 sulfurtransferase [Sulfurimonas sp. SAG-AH-194-I05]
MRILQTFITCSLLFSPFLIAQHISTTKLVNEAKKSAGEMKASTLKKLIDNEEAVIVLDIREPEQQQDGEIYADESYMITRGNLEFQIRDKVKDKNALIVTYCRAGNRGAFAAQTLQSLGYKNAISLKGGLKAWAQAGYPVETELGVMILQKEEE